MLTLMRGQKLSRMSNMQKPFEHSEEITRQKVAKCKRLDSNQLDSTQLDSTWINLTQLNSTWPNSTELTTYDALFGFIQNCSLCGFGGRFCSSSNKLMLPYCQTSSRASFFSQSAQGGPQVTCLRLGKFSHPALHTHYCFLRSCSLEMVPKVKHATTIIWYAVTQTIFEILLPKYLPTLFILRCYN